MWYRLRERTQGLPRGKERGDGVLPAFGMDTSTLLYSRWMTNKDLQCSSGNSAQSYVAAWKGGGLVETGCVYLYASACNYYNLVNWLCLLSRFSPV